MAAKRKPGRPKMTDAEKAAAKRKREREAVAGGKTRKRKAGRRKTTERKVLKRKAPTRRAGRKPGRKSKAAIRALKAAPSTLTGMAQAYEQNQVSLAEIEREQAASAKAYEAEQSSLSKQHDQIIAENKKISKDLSDLFGIKVKAVKPVAHTVKPVAHTVRRRRGPGNGPTVAIRLQTLMAPSTNYQVKDLKAMLIENGWDSPKNPDSAISNAMKNNPAFVKVARGIYCLDDDAAFSSRTVSADDAIANDVQQTLDELDKQEEMDDGGEDVEVIEDDEDDEDEEEDEDED